MLGLALHQMQPIHVAILEVSLQFGGTLKRLFQRFPRQTVKVDNINMELLRDKMMCLYIYIYVYIYIYSYKHYIYIYINTDKTHNLTLS